MIAIFPNVDVDVHNFLPKKDFVIIRSVKDLQGRRFSNVILMSNWANECSIPVMDAFKYLRIIQPELFKG